MYLVSGDAAEVGDTLHLVGQLLDLLEVVRHGDGLPYLGILAHHLASKQRNVNIGDINSFHPLTKLLCVAWTLQLTFMQCQEIVDFNLSTFFKSPFSRTVFSRQFCQR